MSDKNLSQLENLENLITRYNEVSIDGAEKRVAYLKLVDETLKLVRQIVSSIYPIPSTVSAEDLLQVGAIGMIKAIKMYKKDNKGSFKTYATVVIKGNIYHYLRDYANIIRPPRDTIENLNKVKVAIIELTKILGKEPTTKELSDYIKLSSEKIEEILNIDSLKNLISLDQTVFSADGNETLLDKLQIDEIIPYEEAYANKKSIEDALNKLPTQEKFVIYMYYIEEKTRKEIANLLKVSQTQVSRIIKRALSRLYVILQRGMNNK